MGIKLINGLVLECYLSNKNCSRFVSIPTTAKEGDVRNITNEIITIDFKTTEKRKKEVEELSKDLWE